MDSLAWEKKLLAVDFEKEFMHSVHKKKENSIGVERIRVSAELFSALIKHHVYKVYFDRADIGR